LARGRKKPRELGDWGWGIDRHGVRIVWKIPPARGSGGGQVYLHVPHWRVGTLVKLGVPQCRNARRESNHAFCAWVEEKYPAR
ncbi:MAG: hypothetical protein WD850_01275, partial [Candidatus Spechtbacterales bacterium]